VAFSRKKTVLIGGTVLLFGVVLAAQRMQRVHAARETAYIQLANARGTVKTLQTQLELYRQLNGFYPSTEQGLEALVTRPTSSPIPQHWTQLVFHDTLIDPWGRPVVYRSPGANRIDPYDLFSLGPDGVEGNDDIRAKP
jgi:general secretion pathway protein G